MKNYLKYFLILFLIFIIPYNVNAEEKVNIHLFYGESCPHCAHEKVFLEEYLKDKENVQLYKYEVWNNEDNQKLLEEVQDKLNNKSSGVPYTVIGDKVIIGYSEGTTDKQIERYVSKYLNNEENYRDYVGEITGITEVKAEEPEKNNTNEIVKTDEKVDEVTKSEKNTTFDLPILGKVDAKEVSLPLIAVVLGFVDGFNPCAMWILIFLITMLFNMKDKRKMWILGLTFILTSGIVYLMFMLTWLNLATFISKISIIRLLIAAVAIIVGILNLVKYGSTLTKNNDGCDVVNKNERKKIMTQIKKITSEKRFIIAVVGIMVLAASVNIIELMCSIGLPLIFTQILAMNDLNTLSYIIYMLIYILFFLIDDIVIFVLAMLTLNVTAISTKYTKYSHLIGGIIMLIIGLLLIIKPEILMFNF